MNFNSLSFLIFFPVVLLLYWLCPPKRRYLLLLCASYYFYMSYDPVLVTLILFTTLISYLSSLLIEKDEKHKKIYLVLTLIMCLGVLFCFKYMEFLINSIIHLLNLFSLNIPSLKLNLLLPMGISFYTFQTLSYVIDVYKGEMKAEKNFGFYALYVSYFPQLVAGPIENAKDLLPQLHKEQKLNSEDMTQGSFLLLSGFFRKCVIADFLGQFVNQGFSNLSETNSLSVLLIGALFCFQMYNDFAGYSEIAMGCAKMMGVNLTQNFYQPYLSLSYGEFFHRWHYSLNRWFTNYLYIPLGGNRKGKARATLNKLIVFSLCGLWHGARWTYLLWGFYAGFFVCLESLLINPFLEKLKKKNIDLERGDIILLRRILMFFIFIPAALLFRANDFAEVGILFSHLFTRIDFSYKGLEAGFSLLGLTISDVILILFLLFIMYFLYQVIYAKESVANLSSFSIRVKKSALSIVLILTIAIMWISLAKSNDVSQFAYFQF